MTRLPSGRWELGRLEIGAIGGAVALLSAVATWAAANGARGHQLETQGNELRMLRSRVETHDERIGALTENVAGIRADVSWIRQAIERVDRNERRQP